VPVVGQSVPRMDGAEKVSGAAKYVDDISFPGMLAKDSWCLCVSFVEVVMKNALTLLPCPCLPIPLSS